MTLNNSGKNTIGILGSGFGLYGYLPAIAADKDCSVVLLEKYKYKFNARPELTGFSGNIRWVNENDFYDQIDGLIICLPPQDQFSLLTRSLTYPNIRFLILEKPLAINPARSHELLAALIESGKCYRIGYNFQYTGWGAELLEAFKGFNPLKIKIDWHFLANHYAKNLENWKRYNDTGGGAIRFYGIHLIALFAGAKTCRIISSSCVCYKDEEIYKWTAQFEVNSIHSVEIDLDSTVEKSRFSITIEDGENDVVTKTQLNDPFDEYVSTCGDQDRRVGVITPVLQSLNEEDRQPYWNEIYKRTNKLWEEIERLNLRDVRIG